MPIVTSESAVSMRGHIMSGLRPRITSQRRVSSLRISTANFLARTWRQGALFGATPGEAFFVKCDSETNPQDVIEVGICPVKPAEFVIFRISQFAAGASELA